MGAASEKARSGPAIADRGRTSTGWAAGGGGEATAVEAGEAPREGYETGARLGATPGEVFEATHARLPGRFAIKFLQGARSASPTASEDFQAEAEQILVLRHPNIVEVLELGVTPDGTPIIVMEHLEGRSLEESIYNRGPVPLSEALPILRGIATGLEAAHAAGIVHRALRPDNVFIARVAGYEHGFVKLLDFGVSRLFPPGPFPGSGLTPAAARYLAPEQAKGNAAEVDARTDQYSLGAIAFRLLSGADPWSGTDVNSVVHHILNGSPPPLTALARVDSTVEEVIRKAMSRDRRLRFDSVIMFVKALEDAAAGSRRSPSRPVVVPTPIAPPAGVLSSSVATEAVRPSEPRPTPERPSEVRPTPERPEERPNWLRDTLSRRFFAEGDRKGEEGAWTAADLEDQRPEGADGFDSFDKIPRRRWPLVIAVGVLLALVPVGGRLFPEWRTLFSHTTAFWSDPNSTGEVLPTTVEGALAPAAANAASASATPPAAIPAASATPPAAIPGASATPPAAIPAQAPPGAMPAPTPPAPVPAPPTSPTPSPPPAPSGGQPATSTGWTQFPPTSPPIIVAPEATPRPATAPSTDSQARPAGSVPLRGYVWSPKEHRLVPAY